jgi:hypothetical protein
MGSIPGKGDLFVFSVQNGSGTDPASYPMSSGASFPGKNEPRSVAGYSFPSSAEIKNAWSYSSIPHIRIHGLVPNLAQGH